MSIIQNKITIHHSPKSRFRPSAATAPQEAHDVSHTPPDTTLRKSISNKRYPRGGRGKKKRSKLNMSTPGSGVDLKEEEERWDDDPTKDGDGYGECVG